MSQIEQILMQRDHMTQTEARDLLRETREMMYDCEYDPQECEDIMYEMLGLEMDYIFDLIC